MAGHADSRTGTDAIWWVGRDLRLGDNPALAAAAAAGRILPVFIVDQAEESLGAAPGWRLAQSLRSLDADLRAMGSRLILRRGPAGAVLTDLLAATGARQVHLNSALPFFTVAQDTRAVVKDAGAELIVHPGNWLLPPGRLRTQAGTPFQKFTPFWKTLRGQHIEAAVAAPAHLAAPDEWPETLEHDDLPLGRGMRAGAAVLAETARIGQVAAQDRLAEFIDTALTGYSHDRNLPARTDATSGLSDSLAVGEISARQIWHAGWSGFEQGRPGAEAFLSELAWRDFARDLIHHSPDLPSREWRGDWAAFGWRGANEAATAWQRGLTGVDLVDAGMRQLYATGTMHNRVRMVVASFLTKHLLTDWRIGLDWFADTLTDWDPASNAMNWQWVAGCGPDAAPFFRIFNPVTQQKKFDPANAYCRYWLDGEGAAQFRAAAPRAWALPDRRPLTPIIDIDDGRKRALAAYQELRASAEG